MRRNVIAATVALAFVAVLAYATRGAGGRGIGAEAALALVLELEALLVALAAPLFAARVLEAQERGEEGALGRESAPVVRGFAACALSVVILGVVRGAPPLGQALLAQAVLALVFVSIAALGLAAGARAGSGGALAAGIALGALLLGFPYVGGDLIAALPRGLEETAVYWIVALCPGIAVAGTFAGTDPFRDKILYERFRPIGQGEVACQYASPTRVLLVQAALALALVLLAALARGKRRAAPAREEPRGAAPAKKGIALAVLVFVLLSPSPARAQAIAGGPPPPTAEGDIGPMGIRVRLGYLLPFADGSLKVAPFHDGPANRLDFKRDLDLKPDFVTPTFEVEVGWQGAGRVWLEYWELNERGTVFVGPLSQLFYRNLQVPQNDTAQVIYNFRTIALHGSLDIPLIDWFTLKITATTRYAHFYSQVKDPAIFRQDENNLDQLIPGIGAGFDAFLLDKVYLYGSLEWLDFSLYNHTPIHYKEALLGIRIETFDPVLFGVEFYALEIGVTDKRAEYHQRVLGPRIWAGFQF